MGKDCGRGNEQLDAESTVAVNTSPKGRWEGRKCLQTSRFAYPFRNVPNQSKGIFK